MTSCFKAYGLTVKSEVTTSLPLFEADSVDVTIRYGHIDHEPTNCTWDQVEYSHISDDLLVTRWPHIGKIQINYGSDITIDVIGDCLNETVRMPLLGTVMSAILWQRDFTVLHGSCIRRVGGGALVFLGEKQQGKSTLAAWCNDNGYPIVTDDICALDCSSNQLVIHPAFPQIKLSPEALRLLEDKPEKYPKVHSMVDKRLVNIAGFTEDKQNVEAICILETGNELLLEDLSGMGAMQEIMKNMMVNRFPDGQTENMRKKVFFNAANLIKTVPVYRLVRPRGFELLPKTLELLEETLF